MNRWLRSTSVVLKILMPVITVAASVAAAQWLIATKPPPPKHDAERTTPAVRAARIHKRSVRFAVMHDVVKNQFLRDGSIGT